jgi:hypothetical protein
MHTGLIITGLARPPVAVPQCVPQLAEVPVVLMAVKFM